MFIILAILIFPYLAQLICAPLVKIVKGDQNSSFIPFKGLMEILELIKKPKYWIVLAHLPIFNVFILLSIFTDINKFFGKNTLGAAFGSVFVPFIWLPYLGTRPDTKFQPEKADEKKVFYLEWTDALVFALLAATIIRWSTFELYTIPTSSMESSLLVGDYLFVSKMNYGARTPTTPLQVPLTHKAFPWVNEKDLSSGNYTRTYIDHPALRLPSFRLPGFEDVERGDIVVFNYPWEFNDNNATPTEEDIAEGMGAPDIKTNYIKRCVGMPGDTFSVVNRQMYFGKHSPLYSPKNMQFRYVIEMTPGASLKSSYLEKHNISIAPSDFSPIPSTVEGSNMYQITLDSTHLDILKKNKKIKAIKEKQAHPYFQESNDYRFSFPTEKTWSADNYGPIVIPYEGMTIEINKENLDLYYRAMEYYEWNDNIVRTDDNKVTLDGKEIKTYTFKQNYYYMCGDNRHNSLDSRFWGYVPEDHIVGKAVLVLLSVDQMKEGGFFSRIRWDRVLNIIKHGE